MDARSEEIGRLLREQEQAIIAERAQAVRMAGAAKQAAITGQVVSTPGEVLLCEQRWCEVPGGAGPARATAGLARADGTGAWLSCDECAARMLGDARYPVVVISLDQWRQVSQRREQEIARLIAEGKAGQVAAVTAGGSPADPPPAVTAGPRKRPQDGSQRAWRAKPWLIAAVVSVVLGLIFVIAGAEENGHGYLNAGGNQTPGAPELWIGGILIAAPLLAGAVSVIVGLIRATARQGRELDARAGLPQAPKSSPLAWILSLLACLASVIIGGAVIVTQSGQGEPAGKSATNLGIFFVVTGLLGGLAWLVAGVLRMTRGQRAAYRRWLASLSPAERAAYYAAQAAGLMAAHEGLRHSNQRAHERRARQAAAHEARRQQHDDNLAWQQEVTRKAEMGDYSPTPRHGPWQSHGPARPGFSDPGYGPQPKMWQQP